MSVLSNSKIPNKSALDVFGNIHGLYYQTHPRNYVEMLAATKVFPRDFFWMAMDKEGETVAVKLLEENGEVPAERIYQSVHKLNVLASITPPPATPEEGLLMIWLQSLYETLSPWQKIIRNIQSDLS